MDFQLVVAGGSADEGMWRLDLVLTRIVVFGFAMVRLWPLAVAQPLGRLCVVFV